MRKLLRKDLVTGDVFVYTGQNTRYRVGDPVVGQPAAGKSLVDELDMSWNHGVELVWSGVNRQFVNKEAIPPSIQPTRYTTRNELKSGDVFYYCWPDGKRIDGGISSVPFRIGEPVPGQPESQKSGAGRCGDPVEVIWSVPAKVQDPVHYTKLTPEPIDAIEGWGLGFRLANVVKYVARAGRKQSEPATKDLRKALRYLKREIAALEGKASWECDAD